MKRDPVGHNLRPWPAGAQRGGAPGMRRTRSLLCALLLAGSVAGCERGAAPSAPATADASRPPVAEAPAADARNPSSQPPARAPGALPDEAPPPAGSDVPTPTTGASSADATRTEDGSPILRAVRTGEHAGLDRLAFEFEGSGLPAWRIEYVDQPEPDCGSGEAVPVAGDAWLQIRFIGARAHTDAGEPTSGPRRRALQQPVMRELVRSCDFEGQVTWVLGVAARNDYTPRVMTSPSRLVIDIAH